MRFDLVLNNSQKAWPGLKMQFLNKRWIALASLVHVEDVCEAIRCVLEADRSSGGGRSLQCRSHRTQYQVRETSDVVAEAFRVVNSDRDIQRRRSKLSSQVRQDSNHVPNLPSASGRSNRVRWKLKELFARIDLTREQFVGRHHTRLLQLQHLIETGQLRPDLYWSAESLFDQDGNVVVALMPHRTRRSLRQSWIALSDQRSKSSAVSNRQQNRITRKLPAAIEVGR